MSHGRRVLSPDWRQWGLTEGSLVLAQEKEIERHEGSSLQGLKAELEVAGLEVNGAWHLSISLPLPASLLCWAGAKLSALLSPG